ncbi:hypothetical protein CQW23_29108 [Capsicum baccatum]|uniref:Uncharacterized protein n=1 Tax=Capsicum baccatum TaxID=33114 RepID=A0A2G2VIE3_CAPBA|nr:hypothetical protein CQW23_29108 [Capsicum baccatum]
MCQEIRLNMERKLQEEREQMAADLKRDMDQDLRKKLEEEHEDIKGEVEKMVALLECNSMERIFARCNGSTKSSNPTLADNKQPQPEVKVLNQDFETSLYLAICYLCYSEILL